jgi:hypothetical protein
MDTSLENKSENFAAVPEVSASFNRNPDGNGGFVKGISGNPGGRARKTEEEFALIAASQTKTPAALAEIERLMTGAKMEKVRLMAAAFIIERAYGKAVVRTEGQRSPLEEAATEMLVGMLAHLKEQKAVVHINQDAAP